MRMDGAFDPKLRAAMADFRRLCVKYDIGAYMVLASESHLEFGLQIAEPSWSVLSWMDAKNAPPGAKTIRFKHRPKTAEGKEHSNATSNMVLGIRDQLGNAFLMFNQLAKQLQDTLDIEHENRIGTAPDSVPEN